MCPEYISPLCLSRPNRWHTRILFSLCFVSMIFFLHYIVIISPISSAKDRNHTLTFLQWEMLVPSQLQDGTLRAPIPHALPQRLNWAVGLVHRCLRWLLQCTRYGSPFPLPCLPHPLTLGWSHHSTAILSSQEYAPDVHGGLLTHTVPTLHSWLSFPQSNIHLQFPHVGFSQPCF